MVASSTLTDATHPPIPLLFPNRYPVDDRNIVESRVFLIVPFVTTNHVGLCDRDMDVVCVDVGDCHL